MMQTRSIIVTAVAFALGLLIGSTLAPMSLWPKHSIEKENAALREENRLLTEVVAVLKAERDEVRKVLEK